LSASFEIDVRKRTLDWLQLAKFCHYQCKGLAAEFQNHKKNGTVGKSLPIRGEFLERFLRNLALGSIEGPVLQPACQISSQRDKQIQELSYRKQIARQLRTHTLRASIGLNITP